MRRATTRHKPPSRIRYEQSHPVLSCRLSKVDYDLLKQRLEKLKISFATFVKGEVKIPALRKWDDLKSYKPPDIDNPARYKEASEKFKAYPDKYKIGTLPGFTFNIMRKLRGLHNFFLDVRLHSDKILELSNTIEPLLLRFIDNWAEAGAQGVIFPEDWGVSDRLLINPKKWRELFKPSFATLISKAHDRGLHVFMHSEGYIYDIIEDLIDCGLDALQLDDVCLLGIERLGEEFGGRIAFWNQWLPCIPCQVESVSS
ncbi:hypothetical protein M1N81_03970 [Dehalococcoidia bacterium]|nr:hypothetical protein [Dehalococcoidia bacterium]